MEIIQQVFSNHNNQLLDRHMVGRSEIIEIDFRNSFDKVCIQQVPK